MLEKCVANIRIFIMMDGDRVAQSVATDYELDGIESWWGRDFLHMSKPALGPTQPPEKWAPGLSRG
jgi:hypothetical protein